MKNNYIYSLFKYLLLFSVGGVIYVTIELLFRGFSDVTMMYCGGLCFVCVGLINNIIPWEMELWKQAIIGGLCVITPIEYIFGCLFNQDYHIWDYRNMLFNIDGQICLEFSVLWCLIAVACIILDDYLRFFIFNEENPHYALF